LHSPVLPHLYFPSLHFLHGILLYRLIVNLFVFYITALRLIVLNLSCPCVTSSVTTKARTGSCS
jgi:hypothetical protein